MNFKEKKDYLFERLKGKSQNTNEIKICYTSGKKDDNEVEGQRKASDLLRFEVSESEETSEESKKLSKFSNDGKLVTSTSIDSAMSDTVKEKSILLGLREKLSEKLPNKFNAWMENLNSNGELKAKFKKSFSFEDSVLGKKESTDEYQEEHHDQMNTTNERYTTMPVEGTSSGAKPKNRETTNPRFSNVGIPKVYLDTKIPESGRRRKVGLQTWLEKKNDIQSDVPENELEPQQSTTVKALGSILPDPNLSSEENNEEIISMFKLNILFFLLALSSTVLLLPWPDYYIGFILGITSCYAVLSAVNIVWPVRPTTESYIKIPTIDVLPPLMVPRVVPKLDYFAGWMNCVDVYDFDTFQLSCSHSLMVELHQEKLVLMRPKVDVPKRFLWNEVLPTSFEWINIQTYSMIDAKISLCPDGLTFKRVWGKRYPINLHVLNDEGEVDELFLFGRTAREKEEWFRRFKSAACRDPLPVRLTDLLPKLKERELQREQEEAALKEENDEKKADGKSGKQSKHGNKAKGASKTDNTLDSPLGSLLDSLNAADLNIEEMWRRKFRAMSNTESLIDFLEVIAKCVPSSCIAGIPRTPGVRGIHNFCEPHMNWLNAILARAFWDVKRNSRINEKLRDKIQVKLDRIHVPYFIEEIVLVGMEFGDQLPVIQRLTNPILDELGLWIDADVAYNGGFYLSIETKVNLMRLKREDNEGNIEASNSPSDSFHMNPEPDSESSSTTSDWSDSDEEDRRMLRKKYIETPLVKETPQKRALRLIDKVTESKYFQRAAELPMVKKMMQGVSNTTLKLVVECNAVVGTVSLNFPCPPTNRFWYGFRRNPQLWISAKPQVGQHALSMSQVTDWIESKLKLEFERMMVMPNMDDFPIPMLENNNPYGGRR